MKPRPVALFVIVAFVLLAHSAMAKESVINTCYSDWRPFTYIEKDGSKGLTIEIYDKAALLAGLKLKYTKQPWARCLREFTAGKYDAIADGDAGMANAISPNMRPILWIAMFWVHNNSTLKAFTGYSTFNGKVVGFGRDFTYPNEFLSFKQFAGKAAVKNDLQGLKMLDRKRIDAYFGDYFNALYYKDKLGLNIRYLLPAQISRLSLVFSLNKSQANKQFEAAIAKMLESGEIDDLYRKHLGVSYHGILEQFGKD